MTSSNSYASTKTKFLFLYTTITQFIFDFAKRILCELGAHIIPSVSDLGQDDMVLNCYLNACLQASVKFHVSDGHCCPVQVPQLLNTCNTRLPHSSRLLR